MGVVEGGVGPDFNSNKAALPRTRSPPWQPRGAGGTVIGMNMPRFGLAAGQYYLDRTAVFGPYDRGGALALWAAMEMDEARR